MSAPSAMISKQQSLLRSTSIVSLMTFLSRMMGFIRDMLVAQLFGAGAGMDAFLVAFRIPNFMRRLFAEGAFSQAFVPVLAEYQKVKSPFEVRVFLSRIAGSLSAVLTIVTVIGVIATPVIVYIFAPGFRDDASRFPLAVSMLRVTFPYLMLVSLTAMSGAILNTYGYFAVPSFTPVLLNVCMIAAAVYLSPYFTTPIEALAFGVLAAGVAQLLFQVPFLYHRRLLVKPSIGFHDPGVRRVLKLMLPALFGVSIAQINLMIDTMFASFLKVGSVSWLYYTDRLTDFPLGIFGAAIATVILPHLSRQNALHSVTQFSRAVDWGLRMLLLVGVPSAVALCIFSMPMIAGCFAYGKFDAIDVLQTQRSLITLGLGVPAFMMVKILASAFYARQDIKTPVKVGVYAMIVNSLLCAVFILPLAHAGLALASSLAAYVNCAALYILLRRKGFYTPTEGWGTFIIQLLIANVLMGFYLFYFMASVDDWLALRLLPRIGLLLAHLSVAMVIYIAVLLALGLKPKQFRGQMNG